MAPEEGRKRVVIEGVTPEIDCGRFPIKRAVGEQVVVEADIFADSNDSLSCSLLYRTESASSWSETPMHFLLNDRWRGCFEVAYIGRYVYTVRACVDGFKTWRRGLEKKVEAGLEVSVDLLFGAEMVEQAALRAPRSAGDKLREYAGLLRSGDRPDSVAEVAFSDELASLMSDYQAISFATTYKELQVVVDRERARFSAWYEMFPRSCAPEPGTHGTLKDCEARLPYIAGMGFDVLYLPPIHPIGETNRKGKNNAPVAEPDDPGSPWAIGSAEGGHMAVHPQLGAINDMVSLVRKAREYGIEVAIDIAFQCTPDHPYVKEHPEWFLLRPDGSIQYAENPPKKYEDIYPFCFETDNWKELWEELKSVVLFWIDKGIRVFRVDNPHTKPLPFWEWLIEGVKRDYPETVFLSEAFTRPKVMYRLAKSGFSQSYTYFAWRNTKWELMEYFTHLSDSGVREYFRPNLWPNTPDILTEYLQMGGRPAFIARLILAATLGSNYGVYGPAFELCENRAREFGSEEYLDSEKYQVRHWDIERSDSLRGIIRRVNRIRRENIALQSDANLEFHEIDSEQLICYSKHTDDLTNIILVVVNLDPHHTHAGWLELPVSSFGFDLHQPYQVHDLLSDSRYLWYGSSNYVEVNPQVAPAHIFKVRRRIRTERDFDYFM